MIVEKDPTVMRGSCLAVCINAIQSLLRVMLASGMFYLTSEWRKL